MADFYSAPPPEVFAEVSPDFVPAPPPESIAPDVEPTEGTFSLSDRTVSPEEPDDRTFMSELQRSLGETYELGAMVASDPARALEAAGEGLAAGARGLYKDPGAAWEGVKEFAEDVADNPAAAAGGLVGEIPMALLTGGLAGFATKKGIQAGLKKGLSKGATGAAVVGASALGTGASGAAGAGARAEAMGRELTDEDAATAAVFSVAFGGIGGAAFAPKGSIIGKESIINRTVRKLAANNVSTDMKRSLATWLDPVLHFERKAIKEASEGVKGGTYSTTVDALTDLSHSTERVRVEAAKDVAELQEARAAIKPEEEFLLLDLLEDADAGGAAAKMKDRDLAAVGLSPEGIAMFRKVLGTANSVYKTAARAMGKAEAAPYGRIPHVWEGAHRVFVHGIDGAADHVQGFNKRAEAENYERMSGGFILDESRIGRYSTEDILSHIKAGQKISPDEVIKRVDDALGKKMSKLEGMSQQRRNATGYVTFRSLDDVVNAVHQASITAHRGRLMQDNLEYLNNVVDNLERKGDHVSAEVLRSTLDRIHGKRQAHALATGARGFAFHLILGFFNHVAPLLNLASAAIFTPAYILREARRMGADATMLQAIGTTLKALPAVAPKSIRKAFPRFTRDELVQLNMAEGHIPTAESVNLGDKAANERLKPYQTSTTELKPALQRKLNKYLDAASRFNTWQMRHTESAARRMVSVAFREIAEDTNLSRTQKERIVTKGVTKVAGDFNKGMRAQVLEGGGSVATDLLSVALTFQTYIWKKGFEMYDMLKHDKQAFFTMIAPLATLTGVAGVPMMLYSLDTMVEMLDDDGSLSKAWDEFKVENEAVFFGGLSQLPVDASGRMALTLPFGVGSEYGMNPLGITQMFYRALTSAGEEEGINNKLFALAKGLVPSDALRAYGGAEALLSEPDEEGMVTYAPPSRGKYQKSGRVTPTEAGLSALLGVDPASVSTEDRITRMENERVFRQREKVQNLRDQYKREFVRGEMTPEKRKEFLKRIRDVDPTFKYKRLRQWEQQSDRFKRRYRVKATKSERRLLSERNE